MSFLVGIALVSDVIMTLIVIGFLVSLDENLHSVSNKRLLIGAAYTTVISAAFNTSFFSQIFLIQTLLLILNFSKFVFVTVFIYKKCTAKAILLTLILQSVCALACSGIASLIAPATNGSVFYCNETILLAVRLVLLFLLCVFGKRLNERHFDRAFSTIPIHILILTLINIGLSNGLIQTADHTTANFHTKDAVIKILSLALSACLIATLISLFFNVLSKKYTSDINGILEKQIQNQVKYYEEREKTYTEIRKFKHDYINHVNCIQSMLNAKRYSDAAEYLHNISDVFPASSFLYNTGNFVADALLSDKQENVKDEDIIINFSGTIPSSINETDLCTILGNAVDNAIEASRAFNGERIVSVYGGYRHGYFILSVSNKTVNVRTTNDALPFTTKENKAEHGFGLLNIKNTVKKYNGIMKVEYKDDLFILSLTFNNIVSEHVKN